MATDGHIPRLKGTHKYHFFLSKHEAHKKIALPIAKALIDCGFKVWISQHEAHRGYAIDKSAMQRGIRKSECVLLVMTKGIFHRDRFWVTKTEVSYGVKECGKPILCVLPVNYVDRFDLDVKCHNIPGEVHPVGCCENVDNDFQVMARSIPHSIDIAKWYTSASGDLSPAESVQKSVREIVSRYLARTSSRLKLERELKFQQTLGFCEFLQKR